MRSVLALPSRVIHCIAMDVRVLDYPYLPGDEIGILVDAFGY